MSNVSGSRPAIVADELELRLAAIRAVQAERRRQRTH
jgi:hypothetical protein